MRTFVILCVAIAALFAVSSAVDVQVKLFDIQFSSVKAFNCYSTVHKEPQYYGFKRKTYAAVTAYGFEHEERKNALKKKINYKNSEHCALVGNKCAWADGFRLRLRDIPSDNPTLRISVRQSSRLFFGDSMETYTLPYSEIEVDYKEFVGKGRITKEFDIDPSFDPKRCTAPKVKITFEVTPAAPKKA